MASKRTDTYMQEIYYWFEAFSIIHLNCTHQGSIYAAYMDHKHFPIHQNISSRRPAFWEVAIAWQKSMAWTAWVYYPGRPRIFFQLASAPCKRYKVHTKEQKSFMIQMSLSRRKIRWPTTFRLSENGFMKSQDKTKIQNFFESKMSDLLDLLDITKETSTCVTWNKV